MISRRTALRTAAVVCGTGAVGIAAQMGGVLDDGLRFVGVKPHADPDPREVELLDDAARAQTELIAVVAAWHDDAHAAELTRVRAVLTEQLAAVSSEELRAANPTSTPPDDLSTLADMVAAAAAARADGALAASSLAVIKVLAAMAAGLDQVAVAVRRLA